LWQQHKKLERLNIAILPISFEATDKVALPADGENPPTYFYIDTKRTLYHYFGMFSAGFWDIWGLQSWIAYLKLLLKGQKLQRSDGDVNQRGGNVIVDPEGIIRLHHIGSGPSDRPDVDALIQLIDQLVQAKR